MNKKKHSSRGQQMLRDTELSLATISKTMGLSRASVGFWKTGDTIPQPQHRETMLRLYNIPITAWDEPPDNVSAVGVAPLEIESPDAISPESMPVDYPRAPDESATVLEIARHSLDCIRYDLSRRPMTAAARSKARADELRTIALVSKLEEKDEMSEGRYVRDHPSWKALRDAILTALKPFPEASEAVIAAIDSTGM